jgi:hypothetical protein
VKTTSESNPYEGRYADELIDGKKLEEMKA